MKKAMILAPLALCSMPVLAQSQSASLLYSQLTSRDTTVKKATVAADKSKGVALRYGHDIATFSRLGDARLAFEGTWMPRTRGEALYANGQSMGDVYKYRHEYLGLGLVVAWTRVVDFGGSLEVRHEGNAVHMDNHGETGDFRSDITRPWVSLRAGYTFTFAALKPFAALEYALPLAKKEMAMDASNPLFLLPGMAQNLNPKSQISLNAGVRF
jgi:hypothetical protein